MILQYLWAQFSAHPAQIINDLALFFAIAGSWLLLATRVREQRAHARLAVESELGNAGAALLDERTRRINRFFFHFAAACLVLALLLSFHSTHL